MSVSAARDLGIGDERAVDLLEEMVKTPSLCGQEDAVAAVLLEAMSTAGFRVERDAAGNVIGEAGPAGATRTVIVLGHMDTVPGEIPVEQRGGALWGRGVVDAKGPLATAVVAASRAARQARSRIRVIGAVQEEGPSAGARHLAGDPAPDWLVIAEPSGWDCVVLGYKGSQRFTVEITQPCSHTAGAETSAPERAVAFWNALVAWCAERGSGTSTFDSVSATLIDMNSHSDGLHATATLQIGLRLPLGEAPEVVRTEVQSLLPDGRFHFQPGEPAVRGEKNNPLVAAFLRSIRECGGTPRFKVKTGTSDMNVVGPAWRCPMVAYGPGDSRFDHTPEERLPIEDYLRAIAVLTHVLQEL